MSGTVHIVDDEDAVRNSLAFLLEMAGYSTRSYATAAALLSRAGALEDGCVVTDLRMPEINGIALLRRLTELGATLPTIVVTGHGDAPMAVEALRLGAFDFIEKPFSAATITGAVQRALDPEARRADAARSVRAYALVAALGETERDVLRGIVEGLSTPLIAENLGLSPQAVADHRTALMDRLQAASLPELVRLTMHASALQRPPER